MADFLPWLFIIVAVAAMIGGLASLWLSLTLTLSDEATGVARAEITSDARLALLTEKEALLNEIREIAPSNSTIPPNQIHATSGRMMMRKVPRRVDGSTVLMIT